MHIGCGDSFTCNALLRFPDPRPLDLAGNAHSYHQHVVFHLFNHLIFLIYSWVFFTLFLFRDRLVFVWLLIISFWLPSISLNRAAQLCCLFFFVFLLLFRFFVLHLFCGLWRNVVLFRPSPPPTPPRLIDFEFCFPEFFWLHVFF